MKDTNQRTNRLSIAVFFFVIIIVIGFVTLSKPDFEYQISTDQALEYVLSYDDEMSPEEAEDIIWNQTAGYQFVDLRNPYEFIKGHVENSINIPSQGILTDENIAFFEQMSQDSLTVVLYAYDQTEANGPWMILKQLGYHNVKILMGGYGFYSGETYDIFSESEIPQYLVEEPKYNFAEIMENLSSGAVSMDSDDSQPEVVIPSRKKKKSVIEGGC
jgi:rhodanese-related sulfurtransferase